MALIDEIKRKTNIEFRPAEPTTIQQFRALGVPEDAVSFYRNNEPCDCAEINNVRLWPITEVLRENRDYVPGADIYPLGFVVFATTLYGDAFCFDLNGAVGTSAPVVLVSHEIDWTNTDTRRNIASLAKRIAPSFETFLAMYEEGTLDIEPLYP